MQHRRDPAPSFGTSYFGALVTAVNLWDPAVFSTVSRPNGRSSTPVLSAVVLEICLPTMTSKDSPFSQAPTTQPDFIWGQFKHLLRKARTGVTGMLGQPLPARRRWQLAGMVVAANVGYFWGEVAGFPSNFGKVAEITR